MSRLQACRWSPGPNPSPPSTSLRFHCPHLPRSQLPALNSERENDTERSRVYSCLRVTHLSSFRLPARLLICLTRLAFPTSCDDQGQVAMARRRKFGSRGARKALPPGVGSLPSTPEAGKIRQKSLGTPPWGQIHPREGATPPWGGATRVVVSPAPDKARSRSGTSRGANDTPSPKEAPATFSIRNHEGGSAII